MQRNVYITDGYLGLTEYIPSIDDIDCYNCWQDEETQNGYNYNLTESFDEFKSGSIKSRFIATIVRCSDNACIGSIFVSPENTLPDLAIMIYKCYRNQGYGTIAFRLGVKYCFNNLLLDKIYAGCYENNEASKKMLTACGFKSHVEGNQNEKHYLTGEDIIQYDFVIYNHSNERA